MKKDGKLRKRDAELRYKDEARQMVELGRIATAEAFKKPKGLEILPA